MLHIERLSVYLNCCVRLDCSCHDGCYGTIHRFLHTHTHRLKDLLMETVNTLSTHCATIYLSTQFVCLSSRNAIIDKD